MYWVLFFPQKLDNLYQPFKHFTVFTLETGEMHGNGGNNAASHGIQGVMKPQPALRRERRRLFAILLLPSKTFKALCTARSCQGSYNTGTFPVYLHLWWPSCVAGSVAADHKVSYYGLLSGIAWPHEGSPCSARDTRALSACWGWLLSQCTKWASNK